MERSEIRQFRTRLRARVILASLAIVFVLSTLFLCADESNAQVRASSSAPISTQLRSRSTSAKKSSRDIESVSKITEKDQAILEKIGEKLGAKKPDGTWNYEEYYWIGDRYFKELGAQRLLTLNRDSPADTVIAVLGEDAKAAGFTFDRSKFRKVQRITGKAANHVPYPDKGWDYSANQRAILEKIGEKLGALRSDGSWNYEEFYWVGKKLFYEFGADQLLSKNGGSPADAVIAVLGEKAKAAGFTFDRSKFRKVAKITGKAAKHVPYPDKGWDYSANQRAILNKIGEKLGARLPDGSLNYEEFYWVSQKHFKEIGAFQLLAKNGISSAEVVMMVLGEEAKAAGFTFDQSKFRTVQWITGKAAKNVPYPDKGWDYLANQRAILNKIGEKLGARLPDGGLNYEEFYWVSQKHFKELGAVRLLDMNRGFPAADIVIAVLGDEAKAAGFTFEKLNFHKVQPISGRARALVPSPDKGWEYPANLRAVGEKIGEMLGAKKSDGTWNVEKFYWVSTDHFIALSAVPLLKYFKGSPGEAVMAAFPENRFDPKLFSAYRLKSQFHVYRLLVDIFPGEEIIWNSQNEALIYDKTGRAMELDIYLPKLNLIVEYQGAQHYKKVKGETFDSIKGLRKQIEKDVERRTKAKDSGNFLVEIPYSWKGKRGEDLIRLMDWQLAMQGVGPNEGIRKSLHERLPALVREEGKPDEATIRTWKAQTYIGRTLKGNEPIAIEAAHIANTIEEKARILKAAGFSYIEIRILMKTWVVGKRPQDENSGKAERVALRKMVDDLRALQISFARARAGKMWVSALVESQKSALQSFAKRHGRDITAANAEPGDSLFEAYADLLDKIKDADNQKAVDELGKLNGEAQDLLKRLIDSRLSETKTELSRRAPDLDLAQEKLQAAIDAAQDLESEAFMQRTRERSDALRKRVATFRRTRRRGTAERPSIAGKKLRESVSGATSVTQQGYERSETNLLSGDTVSAPILVDKTHEHDLFEKAIGASENTLDSQIDHEDELADKARKLEAARRLLRFYGTQKELNERQVEEIREALLPVMEWAKSRSVSSDEPGTGAARDPRRVRVGEIAIALVGEEGLVQVGANTKTVKQAKRLVAEGLHLIHLRMTDVEVKADGVMRRLEDRLYERRRKEVASETRIAELSEVAQKAVSAGSIYHLLLSLDDLRLALARAPHKPLPPDAKDLLANLRKNFSDPAVAEKLKAARLIQKGWKRPKRLKETVEEFQATRDKLSAEARKLSERSSGILARFALAHGLPERMESTFKPAEDSDSKASAKKPGRKGPTLGIGLGGAQALLDRRAERRLAESAPKKDGKLLYFPKKESPSEMPIELARPLTLREKTKLQWQQSEIRRSAGRQVSGAAHVMGGQLLFHLDKAVREHSLRDWEALSEVVSAKSIGSIGEFALNAQVADEAYQILGKWAAEGSSAAAARSATPILKYLPVPVFNPVVREALKLAAGTMLPQMYRQVPMSAAERFTPFGTFLAAQGATTAFGSIIETGLLALRGERAAAAFTANPLVAIASFYFTLKVEEWFREAIMPEMIRREISKEIARAKVSFFDQFVGLGQPLAYDLERGAAFLNVHAEYANYRSKLLIPLWEEHATYAKRQEKIVEKFIRSITTLHDWSEGFERTLMSASDSLELARTFGYARERIEKEVGHGVTSKEIYYENVGKRLQYRNWVLHWLGNRMTEMLNSLLEDSIENALPHREWMRVHAQSAYGSMDLSESLQVAHTKSPQAEFEARAVALDSFPGNILDNATQEILYLNELRKKEKPSALAALDKTKQTVERELGEHFRILNSWSKLEPLRLEEVLAAANMEPVCPVMGDGTCLLVPLGTKETIPIEKREIPTELEAEVDRTSGILIRFDPKRFRQRIEERNEKASEERIEADKIAAEKEMPSLRDELPR